MAESPASSERQLRRILKQTKRRPRFNIAVPSEEQKDPGALCQWTSGDGKRFFPAARTFESLVPGVYEIKMDHMKGINFELIPVNTKNLIRFPDSNSDRVISEIQKFWDREELFRVCEIAHKRGILLHGPPGSGKSSTIQLIVEDVVEGRNGAVFKFDNPELFSDGLRTFREIQPDTPIVVLMEDLDSILDMYDESEVLNILDGVDDIDKVVFLGTTNFPEVLQERFLNRPSRFDRRFHMPHPTAEHRKIYFSHLKSGKEDVIAAANVTIDIDRWVKDTDEMSIAHCKELFISSVIFGNEYKSVVKELQELNEDRPNSKFDKKSKFGLHQ